MGIREGEGYSGNKRKRRGIVGIRERGGIKLSKLFYQMQKTKNNKCLVWILEVCMLSFKSKFNCFPFKLFTIFLYIKRLKTDFKRHVINAVLVCKI